MASQYQMSVRFRSVPFIQEIHNAFALYVFTNTSAINSLASGKRKIWHERDYTIFPSTHITGKHTCNLPNSQFQFQFEWWWRVGGAGDRALPSTRMEENIRYTEEKVGELLLSVVSPRYSKMRCDVVDGGRSKASKVVR